MMEARMKRVIRAVIPVIVAVCMVGLFALLVSGKQIPVLQPSGEVASKQFGILMFALFLSALVVVPVFTMLIVFSIKYRAGNTSATYRPDWGENKWMEGLWWGIPIVIIGILGVITIQTSHSLDPYKALSGGKPLEVQVVALRWKWLFLYPEQQVATLNQLPIPVNKPVHFTMTSDAPMNAFWIPALGSQVYAMNGMASQLNLKANKLGSYTGYTTNINGEGYAKMTFQAKVLSQTDFTSWAASAAKSTDVMTMGSYHALAEPKSDTTEHTYRLANKKLFEYVVQKYGHNHAMNTENNS
jgi:cytochrome o ubiquinol oxidase subunit 2